MLGSRHMEDILELNVGGQERCAVKRKTLCYKSDSMLASMFSGRWDNTLEKDNDGNVFIDSSPDLFLLLLDFLRRKSIEDPADRAEEPQVPHGRLRAFYQLLRYYGLYDLVFPFGRWKLEYGDCHFLEDDLVLANSRGLWNCAAMLPCDPCGAERSWTFEVIKTDDEHVWYPDCLAFAVRSIDAPRPPFNAFLGNLKELATFTSYLAPIEQECIQARVVVHSGVLSVCIGNTEFSKSLSAGVTDGPFRLVVALTYPFIQVRCKAPQQF